MYLHQYLWCFSVLRPSRFVPVCSLFGPFVSYKVLGWHFPCLSFLWINHHSWHKETWTACSSYDKQTCYIVWWTILLHPDIIVCRTQAGYCSCFIESTVGSKNTKQERTTNKFIRRSSWELKKTSSSRDHVNKWVYRIQELCRIRMGKI